MSKFQCEMFGHILYDPELTYNDVLVREAALIDGMQAVLDEAEAYHIDFTPMGDGLRVQCVFHEHTETLFHNLCQKLVPLLDANVHGKLLFVDKGLDFLHIYLLGQGRFAESTLAIPAVDVGLGAIARDPEPRMKIRKKK